MAFQHLLLQCLGLVIPEDKVRVDHWLALVIKKMIITSSCCSIFHQWIFKCFIREIRIVISAFTHGEGEAEYHPTG